MILYDKEFSIGDISFWFCILPTDWALPLHISWARSDFMKLFRVDFLCFSVGYENFADVDGSETLDELKSELK